MRCPVCRAKIGKPMDDEWPECSCGWNGLMDDDKVNRLKRRVVYREHDNDDTEA